MPLFKNKVEKPPPTATSMGVLGPEPDEPTYPCKVCGRRFVKDSLRKHEPACKKLTKMQRKTFDSGVQRVQGSDLSYADVQRAREEKEKAGGVFERPKTHWRERHEDFISSVAAARGVTTAARRGEPLPPPIPSKTPSDYVKCDYCGRSFNQTAAERHIPFCRDKAAKQGMLNNARQATSKGMPHSRAGASPSRGAPRTSGGAPRTSGGAPRTSGGTSRTSGGGPPRTRDGSNSAPNRRNGSQDRGRTSSSERAKSSSGKPQTRNGSVKRSSSNAGSPGPQSRGRTSSGDKPRSRAGSQTRSGDRPAQSRRGPSPSRAGGRR